MIYLSIRRICPDFVLQKRTEMKQNMAVEVSLSAPGWPPQIPALAWHRNAEDETLLNKT